MVQKWHILKAENLLPSAVKLVFEHFILTVPVMDVHRAVLGLGILSRDRLTRKKMNRRNPEKGKANLSRLNLLLSKRKQLPSFQSLSQLKLQNLKACHYRPKSWLFSNVAMYRCNYLTSLIHIYVVKRWIFTFIHFYTAVCVQNKTITLITQHHRSNIVSIFT